MAIAICRSTSSACFDWSSLASITYYSWIKSRKIAFTLPSSSAKCSSGATRLLQDSPVQQYPMPDATKDVNNSLREAFLDPQTQELACELYQKAKQNHQELRPPKSMLKLLLRYLIRCNSSKKWDLILSLLSDDFNRYGVMPDAFTCSRLVASCIKARKFKIVEYLLEIFESDSKIAVLAFHSAMKGYNKLHMYSSTFSVFEKLKSAGIALDCECYLQIMMAYRKVGDAEQVVALFKEFSSGEFDSNKPSCRKVYRILCESLGKSGRAFEALEYFRDMTKRGIPGDPSIYSSLVCSFAVIGQVETAEELFTEAQEKKMLSSDPEMFLKLVVMYVEGGLVEKTLEIVKAMKQANLRMSDCIFCTIVNGFSRRQGFRSAVRVYEELISEGYEPGQVTYASIINAYSRIGLYSEAESVFSEMEQRGFDKCVVAYSTMISMYGKTGKIREAMRVLAKMKLKGCQPNIWVYNSLLDMHGRAKNLKQVEKLWKEIKRRKVEADKVTYTSVMHAYGKAGEFEECVKSYHEYRKKGGKIDRGMAGIMVGVFSKTSQVDELLKLLRDMKSEGTMLDGRLYRSALYAFRDAGFDRHAVWLHQSFEAT